jgi:uncharacterized SAM-binding protein YcdF (DUF218 family)
MVHLLESACTPIVWVLALIALGLIFVKCLRKKSAPKLGWLLVLSGSLVLYLFSINPVSRLLAYSLESRYRLPCDEVLATLDVVIVLGGGMHASGGLREYAEMGPITYSRLVNGVKIFKRSGAKTLILSGGGPIRTTESEGRVMKALAIEMGVPESQIITETKTHNTMEQAVELAELLSATKKKRIGLVTSALHMMRSERAFKSRFPDDTIVPIPVNYLYIPPECKITSIIPSAGELVTSTAAVHEWIGMVWYPIRY